VRDKLVLGRAHAAVLHNRSANLNPDGACMPHPAPDRDALRTKLIAARLALTDRLERAVQLQSVLRVWLVGRRESSIGAYWPIKGEFDPLPALYRWAEGAPDGIARRIGLPVADRATGQLRFHVWYPGCPMEHDAYDIPKPKDTEEFAPEVLVVPCLGFGPGGVRLGYGGGFFDRTLAALEPRPVTVGVGFTHGFLPLLRSSAVDRPLDAMLTEDGVMWRRPD
jgi:5,10-methenyltetrahydrofolate synthetase